MKTFRFACDGTETLRGRCYFEVEAANEKDARKRLANDASEFFTGFGESDGGTEWDAEDPDDFDLL